MRLTGKDRFALPRRAHLGDVEDEYARSRVEHVAENRHEQCIREYIQRCIRRMAHRLCALEIRPRPPPVLLPQSRCRLRCTSGCSCTHYAFSAAFSAGGVKAKGQLRTTHASAHRHGHYHTKYCHEVSLHNPFMPSHDQRTFNTQHITPALHNGLHNSSPHGSNLREVRLPTALSRGRPPHAQRDAQLVAQLCPSVR